MRSEIRLIPVHGIAEVAAGADIGALVLDAAAAGGHAIEPGDIVVIAQKIVSKAEGRTLPAETREDIRRIVKREARRIVRETPQLIIVETLHGLVCANAGVDSSNVQLGRVVLLPRDPDASAARIRRTIEDAIGGPAVVIVSDTFGRAWRMGQTNVAIGSSGFWPFRDHRGEVDSAGRELLVTEIAHADELAAAAELVMGKLDRVPAAIVRGYAWEPADGSARNLIRPLEEDLFR